MPACPGGLWPGRTGEPVIRRPMWLGTGIVIGVGATLWAEQRVRRRVRRAMDLLTPTVAGHETLQAARQMGARVRDAVDVARLERRRQETELWRRLGEDPPHLQGQVPVHRARAPKGVRRQHR